MNYLLNIRQALKYLNITRDQLLALIDTQDLPVVKMGGELRFRTADMDPWIQEQTVISSKDPELSGLVENALDAIDSQDAPPPDFPSEISVSDPFLFHVADGNLLLRIYSPHEAGLVQDQIAGLMQAMDAPNHKALISKCLADSGGDTILCPAPDCLKTDIAVFTTPDGLHAFAFISHDHGLAPLVTGDTLLEHLHRARITYGLDTGAIHLAGHPHARGRLLHIARGAPPRAQAEPRVIFYFDTAEHFKPRVLEEPGFDFNAFRSISNAAKDQILAEVILPGGIRSGVDVFGESIPYAINASHLLKGGPNTRLSHDGLRLHATRDGIAYWKNGAVCVDSTRYLPGVGYNSGNVDFDGRVVVQGNVVRGFSVKARRKIVIKGQLEPDVCIQGGSSIHILNGIKGGGTTRVESDASIHTLFAEACEIKSSHTIQVEKSVIRCTLNAAKSISVTNADSRVSASSLCSGQSIRVANAGSQNHEPVLLKVEQLTDDLSGSERMYFEKLLDKIHDEIKYSKTRIRRFKEQGSKAVDKEQAHLQALQKLMEKEESALARFWSWLYEKDTAFVEITGTAFPGVTIQIEDKRLEISKLTRNVRFFLTDQGIRQESLADAAP
jgi:hypothetical protein